MGVVMTYARRFRLAQKLQKRVSYHIKQTGEKLAAKSHYAFRCLIILNKHLSSLPWVLQ